MQGSLYFCRQREENIEGVSVFEIKPQILLYNNYWSLSNTFILEGKTVKITNTQ